MYDGLMKPQVIRIIMQARATNTVHTAPEGHSHSGRICRHVDQEPGTAAEFSEVVQLQLTYLERLFFRVPMPLRDPLSSVDRGRRSTLYYMFLSTTTTNSRPYLPV
jgi:hypothetical protein